MKPEELDILIERHLGGDLDVAEQKLLAEALEEDWAIERFVDRMTLAADLHQRASIGIYPSRSVASASTRSSSSRLWQLALVAFSVAATLLVAFVFRKSSAPQPIAVLVSSDHASWEGSLPTVPGSELHQGFLELRTGVATIRFRSGAEMILEAPAHLVLESPMKASLLNGAATVEVPDSAKGFIVQTPEGEVVDLGTAFAVSVDPEKQSSLFEVLSGEIEIRPNDHTATKRLTETEVATLDASGVSRQLDLLEMQRSPDLAEPTVRLKTNGRELTIIRDAQYRNSLEPDVMMVKTSQVSAHFDRRAFFGFDLSQVDLDGGEGFPDAKIILNLAPSRHGTATLLPETSLFSIYGVTMNNAERVFALKDPQWGDIPDTTKAELIDSFQVSRGQQTGVVEIASQSLVNFLNDHQNEIACFLVVRESGEKGQQGLVHAFANSLHAEISGPSLEITLVR